MSLFPRCAGVWSRLVPDVWCWLVSLAMYLYSRFLWTFNSTAWSVGCICITGSQSIVFQIRFNGYHVKFATRYSRYCVKFGPTYVNSLWWAVIFLSVLFQSPFYCSFQSFASSKCSINWFVKYAMHRSVWVQQGEELLQERLCSTRPQKGFTFLGIIHFTE